LASTFDVGLGDDTLAERVAVCPCRRTEQRANRKSRNLDRAENLFRIGLVSMDA
jgi:hypothetical protein